MENLNNINLLPFEKNRYYPGKLLTSVDFLSEQMYMSNKRRFMNDLLYGAGIICGLNVNNLDDTSLMVESGVAIDGLGREIVLENSVVRKVSAIDGYDETESGRLLLCIRYDEEDIQPVYAIGAADKASGHEMNRTQEGCKLFLTDADSRVLTIPESGFLSSATIYADSDYSVTLACPSVVPSGHNVRVAITVEKLSNENSPIVLNGLFGTPAFVGADGKHGFVADISELMLLAGERKQFEYHLTARAGGKADTMILGKPDDIEVSVNSEKKTISGNIMLHLSISPESPREIIERELAKTSLEERALHRSYEYVTLAEVTIERSSTTAIISDIRDDAIRYYIPTIANNARRHEYSEWFETAKHKERVGVSAATTTEVDHYPTVREPIYATGVCEIPLGTEYKKGEIHLSNEVIHGLGGGDVHVAVGCECLAYDAKLDKQAKNTVYGDSTFFKADALPIPNAELAVRVMNDRGSFIVGAKLNARTDFVVLLVRWTATKLPSGEERGALTRFGNDAAIMPAEPTIVVAPNESRFIDVKFKNMTPCALEYQLTEKNSGSITVDGIYTASNKEGVYEIHIYSADNPYISTYAYVVVKEKDSEDGK
ncbi:MAG: hypothetical protein LBQ21_00605 [Clostridiales Family XIII bacterium]|nr:hypothetical protein [Clostridiales Family XIII bacterium]